MRVYVGEVTNTCLSLCICVGTCVFMCLYICIYAYIYIYANMALPKEAQNVFMIKSYVKFFMPHSRFVK